MRCYPRCHCYVRSRQDRARFCLFYLVQFLVSATAGSDFMPVSTTLEYPPGPANGSRICIYINITDDQLREKNETFTVRLSNPMPPRVMLNGGVNVTIIDDEG